AGRRPGRGGGGAVRPAAAGAGECRVVPGHAQGARRASAAGHRGAIDAPHAAVRRARRGQHVVGVRHAAAAPRAAACGPLAGRAADAPRVRTAAPGEHRVVVRGPAAARRAAAAGHLAGGCPPHRQRRRPAALQAPGAGEHRVGVCHPAAAGRPAAGRRRLRHGLGHPRAARRSTWRARPGPTRSSPCPTPRSWPRWPRGPPARWRSSRRRRSAARSGRSRGSAAPRPRGPSSSARTGAAAASPARPRAGVAFLQPRAKRGVRWRRWDSLADAG
ncbi:unnamed protein product, partial [Prorocentrum cordatum]